MTLLRSQDEGERNGSKSSPVHRVRKTKGKFALTHRTVETLRPEGAAYRVSDMRCPALAIRVAPSGLKTWDVAFRVRGSGAFRRLSLGPFPAITLEAARERTAALTNAARAGRDLLGEEKAAKAAAEARMTVADVVELYLKRMVRGRLRTASEIELRMKRIFSCVANQYANEIRRRDLRVILDTVADRGALREAAKQRELVRVLFRWALSQDIIEADPAAGLASYGSIRDAIACSPTQRSRCFGIGSSSCGMSSEYADALKLQLATGARIGEAAGIHAAEVNSDKWLWTLPAERSKNGRPRITPLVGLAREVIECRLKVIDAGPLFTTREGAALTSNCVGSLMVKHWKKIPIEHFTSHDLRRTVATGLVDLGFSFDIVAAVLGHEAGSKNVRTLVRHYVRSDLIEPKRRALEAWDKNLRRILRGETPPSNVTRLSERQESSVA